MRRLAITALIALAAAGLVAVASGSPLLSTSKAYVKVKSCSLEDRSAVFYARMRRLRGTERMQMKFTLLERAPGSDRFTRVRARGLSRWRKSSEGVRAFGYSQEVRRLHDGSAYRMRVRYRWYDQDAQLQRSVRRTSRICRMYVPLPNLRVRVIDAGPYGAGVWRYRAGVANVGLAPADAVPVQFSVDGGVVDSETIPHLASWDAQRVVFYGPVCKSRFGFVVDPAAQITEGDETDNEAAAPCL